ncbi:MAG: ABC transporter permease, partial [Clostridia bacterium]|nr:ABC transporter permease [Clostridia bacterium]
IIPSLNGWTFYELLFIYGYANLPRAIDHLVTDNLWLLAGRIVVRGDFDKYLLRPMNPLFYLCADRFQPDAFGEMIVGVGFVSVALANLTVHVGAWEIIGFIIVVLAGSVIYSSVKLIFASIAFWIKRSQSILFIAYQMANFTKYPMTIYNKFINVVLTFVVPFAFTAFIPASWFLGKETFFYGVIATVICAIVFFTIGYSVWNVGIKKYESAGN